MYDIALVGGGWSSLSVLVRLARHDVLDPGARLALVDTDGETGGGAAYSRRIHPALLLNDHVTKIDRTGLWFGPWLVEHADEVLDQLRGYDDHRVRQWLAAYGGQLARGDVAGLYLPRTIFGRFVRSLFDDTRRSLARRGVTVDVVAAAVTDVAPADTGWRLELGPGRPLRARSVVLATGRPGATAAATHPRYVNERPSLDLLSVERAVAGMTGGDVLLLGSGASAVEVLYCLEAHPELRARFRRVVAISPGGRLPDGAASPAASPAAAPFTAEALRTGADTADALLRDLAADVQAARDVALRMPDVYPVLHAAFTDRFQRLGDAERRRVTDVHVPTYLSLIRRTSAVYGSGADRLAERGQLVHLTGRVQTVAVVDDEVEVTLRDGRTVRGEVALDCRGFGTLADDTMLTRLATAGVIAPNGSNMGGVRVNALFEAAPALLVFGPLLAGTHRADGHIWHLEDIPRIYELSEDVARALTEVLARGPRPVSDVLVSAFAQEG